MGHLLRTRVSKTSTNATSVKSVTSSRKTQSKTLQKSGAVAVQPSIVGTTNRAKKEVDALKSQLGKTDVQVKELVNQIDKVEKNRPPRTTE